ncbi:MAG TPA: twin-arginine translocase TatA/TatE family subunit [Solirubrobacteraceae bacterium]|nr:twin-arginine translocase TatA/TatE family subunit [Solirubrobacteraceae bacterium]
MPNIGPLELVFVLVIALVLLGPKRLPAAAQSLGRSINEFRRGLTDHAGERPSTQEPSDEDIAELRTPTGDVTVGHAAASGATRRDLDDGR